MKERLARIIHFINEEIWRITADDTTKRQFFLIRAIRILNISIKGFINDKCQLKASALTFYSLLSVVPVAALAFGIAKGFGLDNKLQDILTAKLEGQEEVLAFVSNFALNYLERTPGGEVAGIGLVVLFWSVMKVFGNIEHSFNDIWEVKHARSFIRKFSDYISLMLIAIIFMLSSSGMVVIVSKHLRDLGFENSGLSSLIYVSSYLLVWIVFTLLMYIMPNTRVKFRAALFGGIISGSLFQLLQYGYVHFQSSVTSYNAIYGSFAALPFFLIWLQSSWLIVLLGAELSFAFQNADSYEFDADTRRVSYAYKRHIILMVASYVIKRFERGKTPPNNMDLSNELKLPIRLINEVVYELVISKVFSEVINDDEKETYYQPALDINKLTVTKVIKMVEAKGSRDLHFEETSHLHNLDDILSEFDELLEKSKRNILLKEL
ncbi:YihY/virulence factor BrkB family protein [Carboxylicivirga mesophila]|uniref:YihY/virulence factor BrkB family protein n=1 Tax=Carboxylicivirga mesophila TaxID=1166478 RepID=A0ABS5KFF5_9BACT|nr:YihY/virulence factor BrkB family protein [Carboxylicivirga mesophila]MBS2213789.1 YihY/virulence factor BrkB family protein [Carboxylicivirga mesophila]